jgi:RNA polymerase sigma factor (sigma-70 family)
MVSLSHAPFATFDLADALSFVFVAGAIMNDADRRTLFVVHQDALQNFIRRLGSKEGDAQELMQDVAVVVFAHRKGPPDPEHFVGWCCVVARNLAAHRRRSDARRRSRYDQTGGLDRDPPSSLSAHDPEYTAALRELLAARLAELDPAGRILFLRRFVLEYTPTEMAARSKVSASSIRMRVARLVAILRAVEQKSSDRDTIVRCVRDPSGN